MQPGQGVLKHEDKYYLFYSGAGEFTCLAISEDGYNFTRPKLGQVEFNGSKENNILKDGPNGGVFLDPKGLPEERYKTMGQDGGYYDLDTGEQLSGVEGEKRLKEKQQNAEGRPDLISLDKGRVETRHWVVARTSPDLIHWKAEVNLLGNGLQMEVITSLRFRDGYVF